MYRRGEGKKFLWPFFLKKCLFIVCFIALLTAIVVMPASATTVTISPDKDVYISQSSPDGNFDEDSDYDYLFVKSRADKNQRALIHFDLSSIPSGATIDSATLHLYKYAQYPTSSPESRTNNIHRITASWTGAGVTWNNRDTGIPWTTPGGDFVSTPTASTSTGTTVGVWLEWDVKTDVQAFVDGTYPNYGWLIKDANEDAGSLKIIRYRSRENVTYHPKLEVTYTTAPAPQPRPFTPFMIDGYVYDATGSPCNSPDVQITNLNTSENWSATAVNASNRYQLVLDSNNVSAGNMLRIEVSGCSQSKTVEHAVTQNEIDAGGFMMNITLESAAMPDLVVTSKSEELLADGTFNVTYTVANIGDADANASTTSITIDGTEIANDSVPALAIGENYTNTVGPFECPCGTNVTVKVCADSDNEIAESNETNNCIENVLECPPCKPDLTVTGLTTPESIYANLSNTINATVSNIGEGDAYAFNVSLVADGSVVDTVSVAGLKANESVNLSFTWTPTQAGEYELCVIADSNDGIVESNETNNEYCENVTVLESKPELVIVRIALKTPGYVNEAVSYTHLTLPTNREV